MTHPQDPDATSVISWGTSADYTPDIGKHHVDGDDPTEGAGWTDPGEYHAGGEPGGWTGADDLHHPDHDHGEGSELGRRPSPWPSGDAAGDSYGNGYGYADAYGDVPPRSTASDRQLADEILPAVTGEALTCPECGTVSHVTLNRREAIDFCHTCDYPLFWAPKKILRGSAEQTDESLRRLPGTSGRVSVASMPCPFCAEPNAINAHTCVRCGRPMHPVAAPPPPPPPRAYVPPPPPEPVWEPEPGIAWWVWLLLAVGVVALAVVIVLIATGVIG